MNHDGHVLLLAYNVFIWNLYCFDKLLMNSETSYIFSQTQVFKSVDVQDPFLTIVQWPWKRFWFADQLLFITCIYLYLNLVKCLQTSFTQKWVKNIFLIRMF